MNERPDLVFKLIKKHEVLLRQVGAYEDLSNNKIRDYVLMFPQLQYESLETKRAIKLISEIENSTQNQLKKLKLEELKNQNFEIYSCYAQIHESGNDFIASPESLQKKIQHMRTIFKITERFNLNLLITLTNKLSKDEQEDLIQKWINQISDVNSFELLLPVFFHLLKRSENWSEFVNQINIRMVSSEKITKLGLGKLSTKFFFLLLFQNSDTLLQIRILQMFSKFNPVPLLYMNINEQQDQDKTITYSINDKIFYCIDNSEGIFSFSIGKLSAYPCRKSTFLNEWFATHFSAEDNSPYQFGTIDIHFDHAFSPSRQICIADGHGIVQEQFLNLFIEYFNILIVHVNHSELKQNWQVPLKNNQQPQNNEQFSLDSLYLFLNLNPKKKVFILIRDCDEGSFPELVLTDSKKISELFPALNKFLPLVNVQLFCLKYLADKSNERIQNVTRILRKAILNIVFKEKFEENPEEEKQLQNQGEGKMKSAKSENSFNVSPESFASLLHSIDKDNEIVIVNQKAELFLSKVMKFQDDFITKEAFPTRILMKDLRNCENDLKNTSLTETKLHTAEKLKEQTEQKLHQITPTEVILKFIEILELSQSMVATIEIAKMLKIQTGKNILKLQAKKQKLYQLNKDQEDDTINAQINIINNKIEQQSLSIEHIWRELLYMFQYNKSAFTQFRITPNESVRDFILAGEPFELIDGDNLFFQKDILMNIISSETLANSRVLVISVLGPQSSGKSTLLNYMFGCLFATSAGRCTKGIYGSIIQLRNNPDYDYIFIIDSEGLLSSEKNDKEFDRKITCFALSVSHIVLINVKGDMHLPMQNLLEICTLNLHELNKDKIELPQVYFVFNQNTEFNKTPFMSQIDRIYKNIIDANRDATTTAQMLQPDENNIKPLPLAFKPEKIQKSQEDGIPEDQHYNEPSRFFSSECSIFANEIMKIVRERNKGSKPLSSKKLIEWAQLAKSIWDTIEKYPDLIVYSDIKAMQQDKRLKFIVDDLIYRNLIQREQEHKDFLKRIFQEQSEQILTQSLLIAGIWQRMQCKLEDDIRVYYNDIITAMLEELDQINNTENFEPLLYKKSKQFLQNRYDSYKQEAILEIKREVKVLCFDKTSKTGLADLRQKILDILQKCEQIDDHETIFNGIWDEFIQKQEKDINIDQNNLELFQTLITLYRNKINKIPHGSVIVGKLKQLFDVFHIQMNNQFNPRPLYDIDIDMLIKYFVDEFRKEQFLSVQKVPKFNQIPKNVEKGHLYIDVKKYLYKQYFFYVYDSQMLISKGYKTLFKTFTSKVLFELINVYNEISRCSFEKTIQKSKETLIKKINNIKIELESIGIKVLDEVIKILLQIIQDYAFITYSGKQEIHNKIDKYFAKLSNKDTIFEGFIQNVNVEETEQLQNKIFDWAKIHKQMISPILYRVENENKEELEKEYLNLATNKNLKLSKITYEFCSRLKELMMQKMFEWLQFPEKPLNTALHSLQNNSREFTKSQANWLLFFKDIAKELENDISLNSQSYKDDAWRNISSLCVSVIDNTVNKVSLLIQNMNYELAQFACSLQMDAETSIHLFSIFIIYKSLGFASMKRLLEPLNTLQQRKEEWLNIFISMSANNPTGLSFAVASGFVQRSKEILEKELTQNIKAQAIAAIKQSESEFSVIKFVESMDKHYFEGTCTMDELMEYILNQHKCFENRFIYLWKDKYKKVVEIIEKEKNNAIQILKQGQLFFAEFQKNLTDIDLINKESTELFEGKDTFEHEIEVRQEAAYHFLYDLFTKQIKGNWCYHLDEAQKIFVQKQAQGLILINNNTSHQLPEPLIVAYRMCENKRLGLFKTFFEKFFEKSEDLINKISNMQFSEADLGIDKIYHEFKIKSTGCIKTCPCCGRKCEQATDHQNQHQIFTGHQIQGMMGIRYEGCNLALTESCDERKPDAECKFEGLRMKWIEYAKKYLPDWQFDFSQDQKIKAKNLEKYRKLWKIHGQKICDFYRTKHDIPIEFNVNVSAASQKHFILILDDSGSMSGTRWNQAVQGARKFLEQGTQCFKTDTVSLIQFSSDAIIKCENQQMSVLLANHLSYRDGGTYFGPPLEKALQLMKKYSSSCDVHIIIFYTDGGADYPDAQVKLLNASQMNFKFFAICEGSPTDSLSKMASNLGGKLTPNVSPSDLSTQLVAVLNSFNRSL